MQERTLRHRSNELCRVVWRPHWPFMQKHLVRPQFATGFQKAPFGQRTSTHSEVIKQFDSFSLLKLLFLVRNWHCWSRKAFTRQMTPQSREKTAKTAVFRHRWQAWKVVRSIAAVRQRPRTPRNWRCSFAFFEIFLWHFNKKQRAEVIFRLSRPVSCKNQENGSGKRWSLHAPLKDGRRWGKVVYSQVGQGGLQLNGHCPCEKKRRYKIFDCP